jgi:hypothetical protein
MRMSEKHQGKAEGKIFHSHSYVEERFCLTTKQWYFAAICNKKLCGLKAENDNEKVWQQL